MARTFRFQLSLKDQNDPKGKNTFSQFNWLDLVAAEEQSRVKTKMEEIVRKKAELSGQRDPMRPLDPFASDDEDQITALAKKFEAKYGKLLMSTNLKNSILYCTEIVYRLVLELLNIYAYQHQP